MIGQSGRDVDRRLEGLSSQAGERLLIEKDGWIFEIGKTVFPGVVRLLQAKLSRH
jgi:hypothetical protein